MKKTFFISFLFIGAISMMAMSSHYLYSDNSGILRRKEIASSLWYILAFRTHLLFGLFAIILGPLQFIERIKVRYKSIHRVIGYLYALSVLLSSISGVSIAPFAMGGWISSTGFSLLGIIWFTTTITSIIAIKNGDIPIHRKWAYFSYSLSFSSITQRTLLLIPLLTSTPFIPIYQLSAWLPWMINLSIAYVLLRRF